MAFLNDGFSTTLVVSGLAIPVALEILEKTVTPPGVTTTGAIDIATMRNSAYRTKYPKQLITVNNLTLTVRYDPAAYTSVVNGCLSQIREYTVNFPDATTLTFYGTMDEFAPQEHKEGEMPVANVTIIPTMYDGSSEQPLLIA